MRTAQMQFDRSVGITGVDRILQQMNQYLLDPRRIGERDRHVTADGDGAQAGAAAHDLIDQRPQRHRARLFGPALVMLRQAGEHVVHLAHRLLERQQHVGAEIGIVGVPLGIAREQRQLADQILDVMRDEGEAAVELVEALGVVERLLPLRLADMGRRLAPGSAQHVEILPVEAAVDRRRRKQDRADQPAIMEQRHQRPDMGILDQPKRQVEGGVAIADATDIDDPAASFPAFQLIERQGQAGDRLLRPVPLRLERQPTVIGAQQQQRGRGIGDVGDRLGHPLAQRRGIFARTADGFAKAHPFGAIVVAMLEEMLGDLHLPQRAHLWRGQQDERGHRHEEDRADLHHPRIGAGDHLDQHRRRGQHHDIEADRDQRERLEGDGARQLQAAGHFLAHADGDDRRQQRHKRPAQRIEFVDPVHREIADDIEIEVIGPHRRQRAEQQRHPPAIARRPGGVKMMDQQQAANRGHHPQH